MSENKTNTKMHEKVKNSKVVDHAIENTMKENISIKINKLSDKK